MSTTFSLVCVWHFSSLCLSPQSPTAEQEPQEVGREAAPTSPSPISRPRSQHTSPSSASSAVPSRPSSYAKPTRTWCATAACRLGLSRSSSGSWSRASPIHRLCPPLTAATATPASSSQSRWSSCRARPRISYWATTTWRWTGGWKAKWWCPKWDPHVHGYRCQLLLFLKLMLACLYITHVLVEKLSPNPPKKNTFFLDLFQ